MPGVAYLEVVETLMEAVTMTPPDLSNALHQLRKIIDDSRLTDWKTAKNTSQYPLHTRDPEINYEGAPGFDSQLSVWMDAGTRRSVFGGVV